MTPYLARLAASRGLEKKAAIGSLGKAAMVRDAQRLQLPGRSRMTKRQLADALKANDVIKANRSEAARLIAEVRRQLRPGAPMAADVRERLARRLQGLERLNLDEATLRQIQRTRAALAAGADGGAAFTGRSARPARSRDYGGEMDRRFQASNREANYERTRRAERRASKRAPVSKMPTPREFADRVNALARKIKTPIASGKAHFGHKTSIAQIYDAYGKQYADAGSLASFKKRLMAAHVDPKIRFTLLPLDDPSAMSRELSDRSAVAADLSPLHFVEKLKSAGRAGR